MNQTKLCRSEWISIEKPVSTNEYTILKFIQTAATKDVDYKENAHLSLLGYLNLAGAQNKNVDEYIFNNYLKKRVDVVVSSFAQIQTQTEPKQTNHVLLPVKLKHSSSSFKINSADTIRIQLANKNEGYLKTYEYVLLDQIEKFVASLQQGIMQSNNNNNNKLTQSSNQSIQQKKACLLHLYTLQELLKNAVPKLNSPFITFCHDFLHCNESRWKKIDFIEHAVDIMERNPLLMQYEDLRLYDHQKQLFTICNLKYALPTAKLILYNAPTGTGKTMAPVGLVACGRRVLFVCAARHVGLALARAAVSVHQKVGFAFGCSSEADIRLHYFATVNYDPSAQNALKHRTNNNNNNNNNHNHNNHENGRNVELMICDLGSFSFAHDYMCRFFDAGNLVLFWDDVTIGLDVQTQTQTPTPTKEMHGYMNQIWNKNTMRTVILASATLPLEEDLALVVNDFQTHFFTLQTAVHSILAHDCKKSISLINKEGYCLLPHTTTADPTQILEMSEYCQKQLTLLRYMDVEEVCRFLVWIDSDTVPNFKTQSTIPFLVVDAFFPRLIDVNLKKIKLFYLQMLECLATAFAVNELQEKVPLWPLLFTMWKTQFSHPRLAPKQGSSEGSGGIFVTTEDAYTLTDGPTIFLCENVETVLRFCVQQANVPNEEMLAIYEAIETNKQLQEKVDKLEEEMDFLMKQQANKVSTGSSSSNSAAAAAGKETKKSNREANGDDNNKNSKVTRIKTDVDNLRTCFMSATLRNVFVPNKREHLERWAKGKASSAAFTSNISEHVVQEILALSEIPDTWKLLLLMGIGIYSFPFMNTNANAALTELTEMQDVTKLVMALEKDEKAEKAEKAENVANVENVVEPKGFMDAIEKEKARLAKEEKNDYNRREREKQFTAYMEIMKKLADEQKLFLIVAAMEFIWGLNQQFCHGYIGKGCVNGSPEKLLQALGRVGRGNLQQTYTVRFRDADSEIFPKLFLPSVEKREAIQMTVLFSSSQFSYDEQLKTFIIHDRKEK
jgi:hypothetical protein